VADVAVIGCGVLEESGSVSEREKLPAAGSCRRTVATMSQGVSVRLTPATSAMNQLYCSVPASKGT